MKTTKRRFEFFTFYDHTGIARHLEWMAQKGWLLQGIHGNLSSYRAIPPTKLSFTVTYYPDASAFDPEPSEGELCFRDFCAHKDLPLADFRSPFLHPDGAVRRELFQDGLHPTAAGHALMADVLCQVLSERFPG